MSVSPEDRDKVIAKVWTVDPTASDSRAQVWDKLRLESEQTPNPMLHWSALKWAREHGEDVPGWVMDQLYDQAVALHKVVAENAVKEAREVGRVLGFGAGGKGALSAGEKLRLCWRDLIIAIRIAELMVVHGVTKIEAAIAEAAKDVSIATGVSISPSTARRAHVNYGDRAASFW